MKLHRLVTIAEGQGPISVKLTLDQIIQAGKVTNPYQTFVLGWLSEFFKNGLKSASLQLENPIDFESQATHTDFVNKLRALAPADAVALAQYLKDCVDAGECALHDQKSNVVDWIHYVLQRQR